MEKIVTRDDIKGMYYWPVLLDNCSFWIFVLSVVLAFANFYIGSHPYKNTLDICQILLLLIYVMLTTLNDKWLLYDAEMARRRNAIENAFQFNMSDKKTDGYYNNQIRLPLPKYAVNLFESCFYSKNITDKMMKNAIIKLIGIIVFCFLAYSSIHDSGWLLLVTQTVFSTVVLSNLISFFVYHDRLGKIYNSMYEHMITIRKPFEEQNALILGDIVEYEVVKAYFKVRLDEKLYNENKNMLSKEWDRIKSEIVFEKIIIL